MRFIKRKIDDAPFEAASVFDVNGDGIPDIVSGGRWFEGPDFQKIHRMYDVEPRADGNYMNEFSCFPMDVDGNGLTDIITCSWWDNGVYWRENPGNGTDEWKLHRICSCSEVEAMVAYDIDGCGTPEIFPDTPYEPLFFLKLVKDENGKGTGRFTRHTIGAAPADHGIGFGDINGDGRVDVLLAHGWLEQPEDLFLDTWKFHPEYDLGCTSVPILTYDVTGDGTLDIIAGNAHGYGLYWYEQVREKDGRRTWVAHDIETRLSQYHAPRLADIDGDGVPELIAGTRWRAHNGADPGEKNLIGFYTFHIDGGAFTPTLVDLGEPGVASGLGLAPWVGCVTGKGYPDIVAPGKEGLFLFENTGKE